MPTNKAFPKLSPSSQASRKKNRFHKNRHQTLLLLTTICPPPRKRGCYDFWDLRLLFLVLMGRRGTDNRAARCPAHQQMACHCSVRVGCGWFQRQTSAGVLQLGRVRVPGERPGFRGQAGQRQWGPRKIISCSYQGHASPAHTLNVLALIHPGTQKSSLPSGAPREANCGSDSGPGVAVSRARSWGRPGGQTPSAWVPSSLSSLHMSSGGPLHTHCTTPSK